MVEHVDPRPLKQSFDGIAGAQAGSITRAPLDRSSIIAPMLQTASFALGRDALQRKISRRFVQRKGGGTTDAAQTHQAAAQGVAVGAQVLPHLEQIQSAFGHHDVGGIQAHIGGAAATASEQLGARAYAFGNSVAFASTPDLHTAAHEAAHVVQQRGGVHLKDGVGEEGDPYEQHADAIADRVVRGESAQELLSEVASGDRGATKLPIQRRTAGHAVQLLEKDSFPWHGVIAKTWSAALRSSPKSQGHEGTIADLPKGRHVHVVGHSGKWLKVEVTQDGKHLKGYVSQELVDDAVASEMRSMVGEKAKWHRSGPDSGNTFERWASAKHQHETPPLDAGTTKKMLGDDPVRSFQVWRHHLGVDPRSLRESTNRGVGLAHDRRRDHGVPPKEIPPQAR